RQAPPSGRVRGPLGIAVAQPHTRNRRRGEGGDGTAGGGTGRRKKVIPRFRRSPTPGWAGSLAPFGGRTERRDGAGPPGWFLAPNGRGSFAPARGVLRHLLRDPLNPPGWPLGLRHPF